MPITPQELRAKSAAEGWSEDFQRFDDNQLQRWIDSSWDDNAQRFRSEKTDTQGNALPGFYEKPSETPEGWGAWGENFALPNDDPRMGGGGGGSWGGGGGSWGGGGGSWGGGGGSWGGGAGNGGPYGGYNPGGGGNFGAGNAPQFNWTRFEAPNPQDVYNDPAYQFRLNQGLDAIQGSAAASGLLRSGGTLRDIAGYSQDLASQEYGNLYNRELQGWQANYQGERDQFAPQYGAWETMYGGDLSRWTTGQNAALQKYLQREGNIYGLLNPSIPSY